MKRSKRKQKNHLQNIMNARGIALISLLLIVLIGTIITTQSKGDDSMTTVIIETNKGTIETEIYNEQAPITATNFLGLVEKQFYNGLTFHRYVANFVIQGGDPRGDGTGGSGTDIKLEIVPELKHEQGVLAMARSPDPNSASSQFYITLEAAQHLDGSYAVFGKVTKGMDVVLQLREGDVMNKVYVK